MPSLSSLRSLSRVGQMLVECAQDGGFTELRDGKRNERPLRRQQSKGELNEHESVRLVTSHRRRPLEAVRGEGSKDACCSTDSQLPVRASRSCCAALHRGPVPSRREEWRKLGLRERRAACCHFTSSMAAPLPWPWSDTRVPFILSGRCQASGCSYFGLVRTPYSSLTLSRSDSHTAPQLNETPSCTAALSVLKPISWSSRVRSCPYECARPLQRGASTHDVRNLRGSLDQSPLKTERNGASSQLGYRWRPTLPRYA
jgi:hypothetical protein